MDRYEEYFKEFVAEFNQIKDFRLQVLFLHLHIEYWLNEMIKKAFKKPDKILKFTFANKLKIIESLDLIPSDEVIKKIWIVNEIRNHYTHNIVKINEFPKEINDKIFNLMKDQPGYKDFLKNDIHPTHQFIVSAWSIIDSLIEHYQPIK